MSTENERRIVEALLLFLDGRRVLFDPMTLEEPKQVTDSVLLIRDRLSKDMESLSFRSKGVMILRLMRNACLAYLTRVPRPEDAKRAWPGALNDLRNAIRDGIEELERAYGISMPGGAGRAIGEFYIPGPETGE